MATLTVTSNQDELNALIGQLDDILAKINGFQLSFSVVASVADTTPEPSATEDQPIAE